MDLFFIFWLRWVFITACRLFSSCDKRGLLFVAVHRLLLIVVASLVVEHRLYARASVVVARGHSSCGSRALEHRLSSCGAQA